MTDPISNESAGDFLTRAKDDAAIWAAEFRKTAISLGYSDMDEGWLIGWFANAIENTEVVRREAWNRRQSPAGAGVSEQMLIDAFLRGESWRKRNDVDRYVAAPEMVNKAARDYADAALSSEAHNGREVE